MTSALLAAVKVAMDICDPPKIEDNRRDKQRAPEGDWRVWLLHPGRGWGKGFAAAHWIRDRVRSGEARQIALIGSTQAHVRDVMVLNQRSGILTVCPEASYEPSYARVVWPNGAVAKMFSAEKPDSLRGPEHDTAWPDEADSWGLETSNTKAAKAWDNMEKGLRLGDGRSVVTSTPKPGRIVAGLIKRAQEFNDVAITTGSTYENADNLSPQFIETLERQYKGTSLERQEIYGEVLAEIYGALWSADMFKYRDVTLEQLSRVIVGNDPSGGGDMIGICPVGELADAKDEYIVLDDWTMHGSPKAWAERTVEAAEKWQADHIAAERNFGGDMVLSTIRNVDRNAAVKMVTASKGKAVRAQPISLLYEQGRVWHRKGARLDLLEDELKHMTHDGYIGDGSPNRLDAMVWAAWGLTKPKKAWGFV